MIFPVWILLPLAIHTLFFPHIWCQVHGNTFSYLASALWPALFRINKLQSYLYPCDPHGLEGNMDLTESRASPCVLQYHIPRETPKLQLCLCRTSRSGSYVILSRLSACLSGTYPSFIPPANSWVWSRRFVVSWVFYFPLQFETKTYWNFWVKWRHIGKKEKKEKVRKEAVAGSSNVSIIQACCTTAALAI